MGEKAGLLIQAWLAVSFTEDQTLRGDAALFGNNQSPFLVQVNFDRPRRGLGPEKKLQSYRAKLLLVISAGNLEDMLRIDEVSNFDLGEHNAWQAVNVPGNKRRIGKLVG